MNSRRIDEELVVRHIDAENRNDAATALATFTRPKYDLRAVEGPVIEGEDAVHALIASFGTALPQITYVARHIHHAADAVIVEYQITGRHEGEYNGVAPTGFPSTIRLSPSTNSRVQTSFVNACMSISVAWSRRCEAKDPQPLSEGECPGSWAQGCAATLRFPCSGRS